LTFEPTGAGFGAFVTGMDFSASLDDATKAEIRHAVFEEHLLLIFRGQALPTDRQYVEFARLFGDDLNVYFREQDVNNDDAAEVLILSNVAEYGSLGRNAELPWHTNLAYQPQVAMVALLAGVVTPPSEAGGQTEFANLYAALETLPESVRSRLDGLSVTHSTHGYHVDPDDPTDRYDGEPPAAVHSLLRTHPITGRTTLYNPGGRFFRDMVGMSADEGRELSDLLLAHATRPEHVYTHEWQSGDVLVWDNLATSHHRRPFNGDYQRVMKVIDVLEPVPSGRAPFPVS
jgi:taurine dioxygenase